ncbi:MAG: site-specific integrase, partial [Actinomycetota bacterium]|nr:site-specific integrase [Actinomycetota bacterium]
PNPHPACGNVHDLLSQNQAPWRPYPHAGRTSIRDPEGGMIDDANLRHRVFEPTLRRAGLRKIRIHDLRHTFASLLINQGENLKYVLQQLGHASIQTTVDRYGHLMPEAHRGASERLDATVFGDCPENLARKLLASAPEYENRPEAIAPLT